VIFKKKNIENRLANISWRKIWKN